jgi:hypothetical protein
LDISDKDRGDAGFWRKPALLAPPPNPRVQRTRSSPSARHEPLTRHPLGARSLAVAVVLALGLALGCQDELPTEPGVSSLTGQWDGAFGRSPCAGDWSAIRMTLEQSGESVAGEVVTRDGQHFEIVGTVADGTGFLSVTIPNPGSTCSTVGFRVTSVAEKTFATQAQGRCCGTIMEPVLFVRSAGA